MVKDVHGELDSSVIEPPPAVKVRRRFFSILASPFLYASLYLIAIPIFAAIYEWMWADLYQSTSVIDPSTSSMREAPQEAVRPIIAQMKVAAVSIVDRAIGAESVSDPALDPKGSGAIKVTWSIPYQLAAGGTSLRTVDFDIRVNETVPQIIRGWTFVPTRTSFTPPELGVLFVDFFSEPRQNEAWAWYLSRNFSKSTGVFEGDLLVKDEIYQRLRVYSAVLRGQPIPAPGGFDRYLYFSVVTITTLGYGDIVPLTDRARLTVGVEALYGVVMAGLFLNAVARRASKR